MCQEYAPKGCTRAELANRVEHLLSGDIDTSSWGEELAKMLSEFKRKRKRSNKRKSSLGHEENVPPGST